MVAAAIALGAVLLCWPAFLNGWPIVFSDSGAFLAQTVVPLMIWDKPWIYGPFILPFHWHVTLWGVVLAQGAITSHLVWLLAREAGRARPAFHVALCAALAVLSTAPWFVALVMPDILVPAALLCAALLGWGWAGLRRWERAWLMLLGSVAAAAHLSNIPMLLAVLGGAVLLRHWGPLLRAAIPLGGAVALLLLTNLVGHGVAALSPHGSTFLLARLVADGPAARTVEALCPGSGWYLCAFAGRLPADSDDFLWLPGSPVNRDPAGNAIFLGGAKLAPEARAIIRETLRREPLAVAGHALLNWGRQLRLMAVGDVLPAAAVGGSVRPGLAEGFPAAEMRRYEAALQQQDRLAEQARAIAWLHPLVVAASAPLLLLWAWRAWRQGDRVGAGLRVAIILGVLGNAAATGMLSKPHHRYGARVAWLVPLAALLLTRRPAPGVEVPGYRRIRIGAG
ncbi:hypothetical protein ACI6QG_05780 [Roseococcus sp. DSY-14]|uniref:hypothetical protein n=1 Tax=Roseococcus sp. DSY-14 TaxID=3369650 RepID=UPI00387AD076